MYLPSVLARKSDNDTYPVGADSTKQGQHVFMSKRSVTLLECHQDYDTYMALIVTIFIIMIVSFCFCFLYVYASSNRDVSVTKINNHSSSLQQIKLKPNAIDENNSRLSPHNIGAGTYFVSVANKTYPIKYQITEGKLKTINATLYGKVLVIHIFISPYQTEQS
jgi:hypothetical protein